MSEIKFTEKQQRAIESSAPIIVVSAGAGSGKTAVLTERIARLVSHPERPVDIDRFLVVTYTKAAAAEMRSRISKKLNQLIEENLENRDYCNRLRKQLSKLPSANIQTVHSYCLELLRRNCHKLNISSTFDLCSDDELKELQSNAAKNTLEDAYSRNDSDFAALRNALCEERGDSSLSNTIIKVHQTLQTLPHPEKWLLNQIEKYDKGSFFLKEENDRIIAEECLRLLNCSVKDMELKLAHLFQNCTVIYNSVANNFTYCYEVADKVRDCLSACDFAKALEEIAAFKFPSAKSVTDPDKIYELEKDLAKNSKNAFRDTLNKISQLLNLPASDTNTARAERYLCQLCLEYIKKLDEEKTRIGKLTYSDLEHLTIKLLSNDDGSQSDVALEISSHLSQLMVDEYQDSNEVQDTIFSLIAPKDGSLFFVGDIKQSIYRFNNANPKIFASRCDKAEVSKDSEYITMNDNYRSSPQVINTTNDFFSKIMTRNFGDVDYTSEGQPLVCHRDSATAPCELCLIDMKTINAERRKSDLETYNANALEGKYIAKRISQMLDTPIVPDGKGGMRNAQPSDFAILLSSYRNKCDGYIDALQELNIPVTAVKDEADIFESIEASVVISLLKVISNRRQDIPLLSVMRSPFFNFTAEEIAEIRSEKRRGDIWDAVLISAKNGNKKCRNLISKIDGYCDAAKDISCARLLQHIYVDTGAYGVFSAMPHPQNRIKTLDMLYEIAVKCENGSYKSIDKLVSYIDRLAGSSHTSVSDKSGVNIMSIHKSKGLEFPFVFVANLFKEFNQKDVQVFNQLTDTDMGIALRSVDEKNRFRILTQKQALIVSKVKSEIYSEELRKLYVAMTRAREKLFFLVTPYNATTVSKVQSVYKEAGKVPSMQWLSEQTAASDWLLSVFLSHPGGAGIRALLPTVNFDIPADESEFSCSVVLDADICSALPSVESSEVFENFESPKNEALFDTYIALSEQSYPYQRISSLSSKMTPTSMGHHKHITREIYTAAEATDGLTAAEKGTRVHDLLAKVDIAQCRELDSCRAELEKYSMGGETPDELDVKMVCDFANSVWGQRVLSAQEVMHEYRFGLLFTPKELHIEGLEDCDDEHILVNGSIDLLIDEGESLTIVDYKTDSVKPGSEKEGAEVHRTQLELYKNAAEQIFNKPVSELTVFFLKTGVGIKL